MNGPFVTFGDALGGDGHESLRRRVVALAGAREIGRPLCADTVLAAWSRLERGATDDHVPASYLLFDLHRVFFYEEPEGGEGVRIGSVVRYVVDAYPFQPFDMLVERMGDGPHPFLYDPGVLDVLALLWRTPEPRTITILHLTTGEITRTPAHPHPEAHHLRRVAAAEARPPAARLELRECWTDVSLRAGSPVDVGGLVSPEVAPIRECADVANHASLPFSTARVAWDRGKQADICAGKALRAGEAVFVAACEALERFQVAFRRPDELLVRGSRSELGGHALDPHSLFFGGTGPGLPVLTDHTPLHWTWAFDPTGGDPVLVPAQEVWFSTARTLGEPYYVEPTTSGCALGGSIEEAAVFALFEAVERDAFLIAWYLRRACARIDPDSVRSEPFQLLRRRWHAMYPGYGLFLFDATADVAIPTVLAVAVRERGEGPRAFVAASSRLSAERACFTALKDLTGFTPRLSPGRLVEMRRLLDEPERIDGPAHHFELYALDESFERLGFLDFGSRAPLDVRDLDERALVAPAERHDLRQVVLRLAAHLGVAGAALYLKDITHPALAPRGLRCVKAITPGLYPIWFGSRRKRFAVTDRLRRLGRDLVGRAVTGLGDVNLEIHPFS